MSSQKLHVVPCDQGWGIKQEGENDLLSTHATQRDAIDSAKSVAKDRETDLVVHRTDGTFRYVIRFDDLTNGEGSGDGNGKSSDEKGYRTERQTMLDPKDVMSVGSRISWGAVFAGAVVGLAMLLGFGVLGLATGLTTQDSLSSRTLYIMGAIVSAVATLAAYFISGLVSSRITAGEDRTEALTAGVVVWGVLFILTSTLGVSGITLGVSQLRQTPAPGNFQSDEAAQLFQSAGLTEAQIASIKEKAASAASQISPAEVAWWTFGAMVLSLIATLAGALLGAGPPLVLRRAPDREVTVAASPG